MRKPIVSKKMSSVTEATGPAVLDYAPPHTPRTPLWGRIAGLELFPTPVWMYPAFLGCSTALVCVLFDHWMLGYEWSAVVALSLAALWAVVNALIRRRWLTYVAALQVALAVLTVSLSV